MNRTLLALPLITLMALNAACLQPRNVVKNEVIEEERIIEIKEEELKAFSFEFVEVTASAPQDKMEVSVVYNSRNAPGNALLDLYITQSVGSLVGARKVASDLTLANTMHVLDASSWAAGSYFLIGVLKNVEKAAKMFFHRSRIDLSGEGTADNRTPYAQINEPATSRLYLSSRQTTIRFQSIDLDSDDYTMKVEKLCGDGLEWQVIAENLAKDATSLPLEIGVDDPPDICQLRIHIKDSQGNEATSVQNGDFGISGQAITYDASTEDPSLGGQIKPLLTKHCASCHGGETPQNNFTVESFANVGEINGVDGQSGNVVRYMLSDLNENRHMPPAGTPQPSPEELRLIKAWGYGGRR